MQLDNEARSSALFEKHIDICFPRTGIASGKSLLDKMGMKSKDIHICNFYYVKKYKKTIF